MSLRKPLKRTLALLAALRRDGQKCTGPKTTTGKARSSLNASKHGRFAHRLPQRFRAGGAGGERCAEKKDVKNEVQSHHVVENKHKCLLNKAIFQVQSQILRRLSQRVFC